MCPVAESVGHNLPWLMDELIPCGAAMGDDVVIVFKDVVGEPVVAHELPGIFVRVQFGRAWWQEHQCDVSSTLSFGVTCHPA